MDSMQRRLVDAQLGASIDYAKGRLPKGYTVRIALSPGEYRVQLMFGGRLRGVFDGPLPQAISDAVAWAENDA